MISCPTGVFYSDSRAAQRQEAAQKVLGTAVVSRIIGFALFLLGAKREYVSDLVGMPLNTLLSFLTRMNKFGVDGLRDRREKTAVAPPPTVLRVQGEHREEGIVLRFLPTVNELSLPSENPLQRRVVVLTLLNSGLLSSTQAAELLELSAGHVRRLQLRLADGDAAALVDKRCGQQQDYRVSETLKGELLVHWAANAAVGRDCSSRALAAQLRDQNGVSLPDRTLRHHLKKLGLVGMAQAVRELAEDIKKGS